MRTGLRFLLLLTACSRSVPPALAITHITVVDVEHGSLLLDRTVVIRGTRIERMDSTARISLPPGTRTLDGSGRFLIPGLWDMHIHVDDAHTAAQLLGWGITGA
ncbi:MAG TPA: hypothetical protein VKP10_03775, partial [Gemmatimonadales bacterium]|nr:hypothetical protein [Gemmatimonadales bacterium]